jgi:hypothetical protein
MMLAESFQGRVLYFRQLGGIFASFSAVLFSLSFETVMSHFLATSSGNSSV